MEGNRAVAVAGQRATKTFDKNLLRDFDAVPPGLPISSSGHQGVGWRGVLTSKSRQGKHWSRTVTSLPPSRRGSPAPDRHLTWRRRIRSTSSRSEACLTARNVPVAEPELASTMAGADEFAVELSIGDCCARVRSGVWTQAGTARAELVRANRGFGPGDSDILQPGVFRLPRQAAPTPRAALAGSAHEAWGGKLRSPAEG